MSLHLGKRKSAELFQEPIYVRQKEQEIQQQFLSHVIGLKQKTCSHQNREKYNADAVQGRFLDTGYQRRVNKDIGSCCTCFQAIQLQINDSETRHEP